MTTNRRGVALVAAAAVMWGTWSLILRPAGVSAWTSAPIVFAIMGVLALPLALRERSPARWDRPTVVMLALHGSFAAGNVIAYFAAMAETTLAVAALTHYLAPVFVAVMAPWIDRERIAGAPVAAAVALLGLLLVLEPWAASTASAGNLQGGALLGTLSAVFFAGNVFFARRLEPRLGATRIIAYHALIAALVLVPFAGSGLFRLSSSQLGLLALGAAGPGMLAGVLFVTGLATVGSSRAAVLAYLEPLVAVLLGWLVWNERVRPIAALGAACIVAGGLWVAREP